MISQNSNNDNGNCCCQQLGQSIEVVESMIATDAPAAVQTHKKTKHYLFHNDNEEDSSGAAAAPTTHKLKQHHEDDSADEVTTACNSSWVEDNSSQLDYDYDDDESQISCPQTIISLSRSQSSSLLSAHEHDADDEADHNHGLGRDDELYDSISSEEEEDELLLRYLSHSSSYYSAIDDVSDSGDNSSAYHFELHPDLQQLGQSSAPTFYAASMRMVNEDELYELTERAHHMLQREQSPEYKVDDYFVHQNSDATLLASLASNYSPIDLTCRAKMMEWSFRVLEYSFPLRARRKNSSRKYSVEAIQIVSQAFNLVDRMATQHYRDYNHEAMDRSQYKLICMGCLHITAKSCGLFGLYDGFMEFEMEEEEDEEVGSYTPACDSDEQSAAQQAPPVQSDSDECDCCYLRQCSTSSLSISSKGTGPGSSPASEYDNEEGEGQTVVSTPSHEQCPYDKHPSAHHPREVTVERKTSNQNDTAAGQPDRSTSTIPVVHKRPPLNILSLTALSTLCQNEYSLDELIEAEMNILKSLDWKLMGATSVDWCHILLDLLALCVDAHDHHDGVKRYGINMEDLLERVLRNVEGAIESNLLFDPSMLAMAAVLHALDHQADEDAYGHYEFEMQSSVHSMYKKIVWGMLPHSMEEVDSVRLCL